MGRKLCSSYKGKEYAYHHFISMILMIVNFAFSQMHWKVYLIEKVFVIFICPYDPFGDDRMIYTIRNHCVENPELPYEDGARTIFLYTKGRKGRDNESLSQLFHM